MAGMADLEPNVRATVSTELVSQEEGIGLFVNRYCGPGDTPGPHRFRYLVYVYDPEDVDDHGGEVTLTRAQAERLYEALRVEFAQQAADVSADAIRAAWEKARGEVTANYVSDEAWDAIVTLDELLDPLRTDTA